MHRLLVAVGLLIIHAPCELAVKFKVLPLGGAVLRLLSVVWVAPLVAGLDNGLAGRPPLGWVSRERFACNTDCHNYPSDCISEGLVRSTVKAMVAAGFTRAGFVYVGVDDCWQAATRDPAGRLRPDPARFPAGMAALADYVHEQGMKLGLYVSTENVTCHGFPGSKGRLTSDAQTLASWGVDMVTADSCGVQHTSVLDQEYVLLGRALNQTGRQILYVCNWPLYQRQHGIQPDLARISSTCNVYQEADPMVDSWEALHKTVKYFGDSGHGMVNFSHAGSWNLANPILVGDYGLSPDQQRMQVAIWCVLASPLLLSADVRAATSRPEFHQLLLNPRVLAISQDPLGIMGKQVMVAGQVKVWLRPIIPRGSFAIVLLYTNVSGGPSKVTFKLQDVGMTTAAAYNFTEAGQVEAWLRPISPPGSFALALIYVNISGGPKKVSVKLQDLGMITAAAYSFTEVFDNVPLGVYKPWYTFNAEVNPTGVLFINATALR